MFPETVLWLCLIYCGYVLTPTRAQFINAFAILTPSTVVSHVDCNATARSLTDCAVMCMHDCENCTAATFVKNTKTCSMSRVRNATTTFNSVFVTLSEIPLVIEEATVGGTQYGTSFVTGFICNGNFNDGTPKLLIVTTVSSPTNVWVTIPHLGVHQELHVVNGHKLIQYSNSLMPAFSTVITANAVKVTSDLPIALYSMNYNSASAEMTMVLPVPILGQAYIVDTHNSTTWGKATILVMGVTNNTEVRLDLPSGASETVVLNEFETYQRLANTDTSEIIAGTIITASAPVSVHAGHTCANVPNISVVFCDVIVTSVPPLPTLGQVFIVPYQRPRTDFSLGFAAPNNLTDVVVRNVDGTAYQTYQLNKGGSVLSTYTGSKIFSVTSNQPILLTQYAHGGDCIFGDPSQTVIPSINQYGQTYTFTVPIYTIDPSVVSIAIHSDYGTAGLRLNGTSLIITESATVTVPEYGVYDVIYTDVIQNMTYTLNHTDPTARFAAWLYARNDCEEYITVLGYTF